MISMLHGAGLAFSSLFTIVSLLGTATAAGADPIPITVTSGFIQFEPAPVGPRTSAFFDVRGPHGFRLSGSGGARAFECEICDPDMLLALGVHVSAENGELSYRGETRAWESGPLTGGGGQIAGLGGSVRLPAIVVDDLFHFETAFSLDSLDSIVGAPTNPDDPFPPPPQTFRLTGNGRAQGTFRGAEGTVWILDSLRLDFNDQAAIPEPGSVLLVGSALTGVWLRRRFRRNAPGRNGGG